MSQTTTSTEDIATVDCGADEAEKTERAAIVTSPEKIVYPAPTPNYPRYRIGPITLATFDANESELYKKQKDVEAELEYERQRLQDLQARLFAENQRSLLIVLQSTDAGGKNGTIKHVFSGLNPLGCRVWSFKEPTEEEASHDFLWRYEQRTPEPGMITIFNRSHYEDVLVVRVKQLVPEDVWRQRYQLINEFEHKLMLNNTTVLKFFLHISKDEQKRRFEKRLERPDKHWKFSSNDIKERERWDEYQVAFEDVLNRCTTKYAPWYIVPANKKWYRNLVVARVIADTLEAMNPQYPSVDENFKNIMIPD